MATSSALPPEVAAALHALNNDILSQEKPKHQKQTLCPNVKLRIHFDDVSDSTTCAFMNHVDLATLLGSAILDVQERLFTTASETQSQPTTLVTSPFATMTPAFSTMPHRPKPPSKETFPTQEVRSVTLILEHMDGVAYTTGTSLDDAHKEIHLSIGYCANVLRNHKGNSQAFVHEIVGVTTHEMVHCFQHNCHGTAPGGLIEGLADYVRLKAGLAPPHWKKFPATKDSRGEKWDEGYQKTAWFLEWVEKDQGLEGTGMCLLNKEMRREKWNDGKCWQKCFGEEVEVMWKRYRDGWEKENKEHEG